MTWATLPANSVAHSFSVRAGARPYGWAPLVGSANVPVTAPAVVMRLTLSLPMLVSAPGRGRILAVGWPRPAGNSLNDPAVLTSATWLALYSVNHNSLSDPVVIPVGPFRWYGERGELARGGHPANCWRRTR